MQPCVDFFTAQNIIIINLYRRGAYRKAIKPFLRAVGVLFSPMVSGWAGGRPGWRAGGRREKVCPGCISETVRCRKLILGRDIG